MLYPQPAYRQDTRQPSSTRSGPGRKHKQGALTESKSTTSLKAGAYGRGLRNHINRKNLERCKFAGPHDARGAVTLIGNPHPYQAPNLLYGGKRVWLGGISAQRGY